MLKCWEKNPMLLWKGFEDEGDGDDGWMVKEMGHK